MTLDSFPCTYCAPYFSKSLNLEIFPSDSVCIAEAAPVPVEQKETISFHILLHVPCLLTAFCEQKHRTKIPFNENFLVSSNFDMEF